MQISSFKSLSIASRLLIGFVTLLAFLVVLAMSQSVTLRLVGGQLKRVVDVNNNRVELAHALLDSINELAIRARAVILTSDLVQLDAEVKQMHAAEQKSDRASSELKAALSAGNGTPATEDERRLLEEIAAAQERAMPYFVQAAKQAQEGNNFAAVKTLTEKAAPDEETWRKTVAQFIRLQQQASARSASDAAAAQTRVTVISTAMAAAAVLIGAVIAYRIIGSITRPIARAVQVSERIAQGDLTAEVQITSHDETGRMLQAIATMQARLRDLVSDIQVTAASIHHASSEVAAGNQDLSVRTEQAASSLQETAASMDQLTDTVRRSAEAARQADQLASSAAHVAERGGTVVSQVIATMQQINASSKRISDIIAVIDSIAFQTNILALNAAVEAARAGEQGRGFAVVASEVRGLAGRAAAAAKEIKALIGSSVEKVEAGSRLVADAGSTMADIVGSVLRVTDIVGEITASSTEQHDGIVQVNHAIGQLDRATQQNAALVEQGTAAAELLKDQAGRLTSMVSGFRVAA